MSETNETVITGNYTLTIPMPPNGAQLVLTGYVYNKDELSDVHKRIDDMQDVAQRQLTRAGIGLLESQRKSQLANLASVKAIYQDLVKQVQGGAKLKTQQKQQYDSGQATIDQILKNIDDIDRQIADAQKKVALPD